MSMLEQLLGLSSGPARAPNTFATPTYIAIALVILIGAIYAMPNLYQPDPALQIRSEAAEGGLPEVTMAQAEALLAEAGISILRTEMTPRHGLIRLADRDDQLRARTLLHEQLNLNQPPGQRFIVALNMAPTTPAWLQALGAKPLALGLDLSGGVHFMLEVDMPGAINERMVGAQEFIRTRLRDAGLRYVPTPNWVDGTRMSIAFYEASVRDGARDLIAQEYPQFNIVPRDVGGQPGLWLTMSEAAVQEIEEYAIAQNLVSLRNRVNELGVSEPLVQRAGATRIAVDLPGVQDSADAKRILDRFATLEFRLVAPADASPIETQTFPYEGRTVRLLRSNIVTGERVINAVQDFDQETNRPQVSITLDKRGGDDMHRVSARNVGRSMAIIFTERRAVETRREVDGQEIVERRFDEEQRVINVATIQSALGYRFRITGIGLAEARDLALLLRAGALAAPMYIVEERTVGASLGEENIRQGRNAMILGYALVVLFMLGYYKLFGLAANLALTVNVILLLAIMSVLGATMTLPGIAGLVLTVGMAVDANVLIFSRIKEELANNSPQAAIEAGFERALSTILDANITTMFVALILLAIGTGPVKGFAVVLAIGILTSVFTALVVTRALVNLMYGGRNLKKVLI